MAIARDILAGVFGATAGGLRGHAAREKEKREKLARDSEKELERAFMLDLEDRRDARAEADRTQRMEAERARNRREENRFQRGQAAKAAEGQESDVISTSSGLYSRNPVTNAIEPILGVDGSQLMPLTGTPPAPRRPEVETYVDEEGQVYRSVVNPDGTLGPPQPIMVGTEHLRQDSSGFLEWIMSQQRGPEDPS